MDTSLLIDSFTKCISAGCGVGTLYLIWRRALPQLAEIHKQTNSLAIKAEAGARALGVQEGLKQAVDHSDPAVVAAAAALVLDVAAKRAAEVLAQAAASDPTKGEQQ